MNRIAILPESLVSQIAAGEVIERPVSVVKELVENALDASATRVDIHVTGGGLRLISVRDDGCGMSEHDAALAFRRHATSKIRAFEDLENVGTLGFRGEALPSIAAVGCVRLHTRRPEDPLGVEIVARGDDATQLRAVSCSAGTHIEVAELFHSVPARRKFLKSPDTEALHIARWIEEIALVRPDVRFAVERDGRASVTLLPTSDVRERVIAVLPARLGERMRELDFRSPAAEVRGFASPTDVMRGTTNDIHLFVNTRPVRDRVVLSAVREAYRDALPSGRHPAVVLYLGVPPGDVDANVHPTKSEVRFRDSRAIHQSVREAIVRAIGVRGRAAALGPAQQSAQPAPVAQAAASRRDLQPPLDAWLAGPASHVADRAPVETELGSSDAAALRSSDAAAESDGVLAGAGASVGTSNEVIFRTRLAADSGSNRFSSEMRFQDHRYVGQFMGTYLALEGRSKLVLLDQHAAHERVLFEQLRRSALEGKLHLQHQLLLDPVWLELGKSHAEALELDRELLASAGFELDFVGSSLAGRTRVAVRSVPSLLQHRAGRPALDLAALLEETASGLLDTSTRETRDGIERAVHHVLATAACHAAVRKGDRLRPEEVHALLRALDEHAAFANCPHGRPIAWTLEEREIARHFLRPLA